MSERPHGIKALESQRGSGVSAASVHLDRASERLPVESKRITNKRQVAPQEQLRRGGIAVKEALRNNQDLEEKRDFLLAQLEQTQDELEDATSDASRNEVLLRQKDIESKLRAIRDNALVEKHSDLSLIEEHSSLEATYNDTLRRYSEVGTATEGDSTPATQRLMRTLRGRIDELLPTIAKRQIEADLAIVSKEQYARTLEIRLREIEEFDEKEGYEDTAPELVERDLINEKLKQLSKWGVARETPTIAERKQRMRSLKARITTLNNDMEKNTRVMNASWNPFTRWNLSKKIVELREKREAAQAMLRIFKDAGEAPNRATEVRRNSFNEIQDNDLEEIEEQEQALAAK